MLLMSGEWEIGLCALGKNPGMYCFTLCMPCSWMYIQAFNAKLTNPHNPNAPILAILFYCCGGGTGLFLNRFLLREKLGIRGSLRNDILVWSFCAFCAVIQEYMQTVKTVLGDENIHITTAYSMISQREIRATNP
jgi:Cys-rich protein (TIGR01571 family)